MKKTKPEFGLSRIPSDGTKEPAHIVSLVEAMKAKMNRRGFFGAGLTAAAAVLLDGCDKDEDPIEEEELPPDPEPEPEPEPVEPKPVSPNSAPVESSVRCDTKKAHFESVRALAMHPDGKMFFSGSEDNTIKMWSLPEGAYINTLTGHSDTIFSLAVSPDGKQLFSGSFQTIKIWSLPEGTLVKTLTGQSLVFALAVSPDGKWLASGGSDRTIKIWSLPDGTLSKTLTEHTDYVYALAFTPDGTRLVSGGRDKILMVWNFPGGTALKKWGNYTGWVYSLFVTPDGNGVVTGCFDNILKLRNLSDGAISKSLKTNGDAVAVTPDGGRFVSVDLNDIKLWSLPDATLIKTVRQEDAVRALAISPDGKWLVSGMSNGAIKLWHMPDVSYENCMLDPACIEDTVKEMIND